MEKLIPYLKTATPQPGYLLLLEFEDGLSGTVDLSKWVGKGVFGCWTNEENFRRFSITPAKKLEWNEEIDMDPDAFYLQLAGKNFAEYAADKQRLWHTD